MLEPSQRLRSNVPFDLAATGHAEAQELAFRWSRHSALRFILKTAVALQKRAGFEAFSGSMGDDSGIGFGRPALDNNAPRLIPPG
jgi:hypothetical protein